MKVVSARKRAKYDDVAENFVELNKLERDSAFMAEFVLAVNSRLTAAKTPQ